MTWDEEQSPEIDTCMNGEAMYNIKVVQRQLLELFQLRL